MGWKQKMREAVASLVAWIICATVVLVLVVAVRVAAEALWWWFWV